VIYEPPADNGRRLVGRVVARGRSDELNDRNYVIVDGVDGRSHYVDIGRAGKAEAVSVHSIISIGPKRTAARSVDRTVAEIAAAHAGRYSVDLHLHHDPTASEAFVQAHVHRLEAMRRAGVGVFRDQNASWIIAPDYLAGALAFERTQARHEPVEIEVLTTLQLDRQVGAEGATWLDRELVASVPTVTRDAGFGRQVREALARRRQWLIDQELARGEHDRVIYRANLLELLRQREIARLTTRLSGELHKAYIEVRPGQRIEGIYRCKVDLASGRFALIETSHEFTLVPWRPLLERHQGKKLFGMAHSGTISWTIGHRP